MTESGYYYYTHPFTEDERLSLKEFFGRDLFDGSYKELSDEQLDQISARIMPRARSSIRVSDLLAPLRKLKALTDTEYSHLRSGSLEAEEQAVRLMEYLMYKGSYGLASLYLSLLTSSERKKGLPAHYQLARELREIVQEYGVTEDSSGGRLEGLTNGTEAQAIPLRAAVKKLRGVRLSPETARTLASHLNLPHHQRVSADLCELCVQWLKSRSTCDVMELVEGMVVTEGLGRYTTRLCGPSSESPRDMRNFLLTLGERWVEIARYLGFSREEIDAIMQSYPDSIEKQVEEFLEEWKMPDSGQKTLPLMHKLKALAGIVEPKRDRANSLPSGRRPWLDNSGLPPRRLDPYPHPHKRPPSPPRTPDNHHHHNSHDCHHSHSGHHVHSFHHHHDCPFHNAVDKQVEGYYDDYENAPYSSYSGTLPVGSRGVSMLLTLGAHAQ
jgi:hypothetical protein